MPDKVIHEVKFIETDDGYRIEIKGDKERLKKMFGRGFGPMGFCGRHHRHRGPWGRGHGFPSAWLRACPEPAEGAGGPPWAWGPWAGESEEDETDDSEHEM